MTGYGKAVVAYKDKKINVEVKSLNSKQLDLQTRISPLYREKEMEIRQMIQATVIRGKVDFTVDATPINGALVENYYQQMKTISEKTGIPMSADPFYTLLRMPDVLTKTEQEVLSDDEWAVARQAVGEALDRLVDFRRQEGAALQKKFAEKIDNIEQLLMSIEPYEKSRVEKIRQRIVDIQADDTRLRKIMDQGKEKARESARRTLNEVRHVIGYRN